jgi:hypothetical protein
MKKLLLYFFAPVLMIGILGSCNDDNKDAQPAVKTVIFNFNSLYNNDTLHLNDSVVDPAGNKFVYTTAKYYISNLTLIDETDKDHLVSDILLVDVSDPSTHSLTVEVPEIEYKKVKLDFGVRQDLNQADPALYPNDHPLSVTNDMYWSWMTFYIFSKTEGFAWDAVGDSTANWLIHAGLDSLYRPDIELARTIVSSEPVSTVDVNFDLYEALGKNYPINLTVDGRTHTTDNPNLAWEFMENAKDSFK